jgi:hypothetical protein
LIQMDIGTEAYKIGIKLVMTGNTGDFLKALAGGLTGCSKQVDALISKFGNLKTAVAGAFAAHSGDKMLHGISDLIEKTQDLSHELVQLQKMGLSQAQLDAANKAAWQMTRAVPGMTKEQALGIFGAGYSPLGFDATMKLAAPMAKFESVVSNATGDYDSGSRQLSQILRSADMLGQFTDPTTKKLDADRFEHFLGIVASVENATHQMVNPATWLQLAQQGGPSLMHMSDPGLITMALTSQYMGGGRAGTAMMSLYQQMIGGTMYSRNAEEMQRLGLISADEWHKDGGHVVLAPDAAKRLAAGIGNDPLEWVSKTLIPAMDAHGITDPNEQMQELFRLLTRQTTQRASADWIRNMQQMIQERGRIEKAPGLDEAMQMQQGDVTQGIRNMQSAWHNLLDTLVGQDGKAGLGILNSLKDTFNGLSNVLNKFPTEAIQTIDSGIMALGAALVTGGPVMMALGGPAGLLVGGIVALGVVFASGGFATGWKTFVDGVKALGNFVASMSKDVWDKIKGLFGANGNGQPGGVGASDFSGAVGPMMYTGGGRLIPASYVTGGGYSGGVSRGLGSAGGRSRGLGNAGSSYVPVDDSSYASLTGNAYLKAQRAGFAAELNGDPHLREQLAAAASMEDDRYPVPVIESLMNRMALTHGSIKHGLFSGFYGPIKHGRLLGRIAYLERHPAELQRYYKAIASVLAGSNQIQGFTDQGLPTDPNGRWPGGMHLHGDVYNDWGGGPGHAAARRFRLNQ